MTNPLPSVVTFASSAFNTTEPKDHFINPGCFGDDVCRWLIKQLRQMGTRTAEEPGQEDFGWYFTFHASDVEHCFVVGYRPEDDNKGIWIGTIERHIGLFRSMFGGRQREIRPEALEAIHSALVGSGSIEQVRWHYSVDLDSGCEDGVPKPT